MRFRLSLGLLLLCAGLLLAVVPLAAGQESASRKKEIVDGRINALERKIEAAKEREGVLTAEIEAVSAKIHALEDDVSAAETRLDRLESVLALHQQKLDRLNRLYVLQTRKLVFLQRQHKEAIARLSKRLVEIYTSERTSEIAVVLEAGSFSDMLDQLEFLNTIGAQDERIAQEVEGAKLQMQETRNATRKTRKTVAATTREVAARTAEQRAVRDRLAWSQRELATARRNKR
jgi:peptidoglycan hydrolase CwlO-like protein